MLRSFDYAAWACVMHLAEDHPDWFDPMLQNALEWRDLAGAIFMGAYAETAEGCASWPADRAVADRLIDLLQLEKALYEIGYEAANRPGWLIIPVRGVARILDAHAAKEESSDGE
jgi:maltose alpha-D-glucosyltransferase/alpha-amylase